MNSTPSCTLRIAGTTLVLRADASVYWPAENTAFVADVHLGKAALMQRAGISAPDAVDQDVLHALSRVVSDTGCRHLVILGDFVHGDLARTPAASARIAAWTAAQPAQLTLVEGNHDAHMETLPPAWGIRVWADGRRVGPFELAHGPHEGGAGQAPAPVTDGYRLCGHVHPAVRLRGRGRRAMRVPAFIATAHQLVLPAFGALLGHHTVQPPTDATVVGIAGGTLVHLHGPLERP